MQKKERNELRKLKMTSTYFYKKMMKWYNDDEER